MSLQLIWITFVRPQSDNNNWMIKLTGGFYWLLKYNTCGYNWVIPLSSGYHYDNDKILNQLKSLLNIEHVWDKIMFVPLIVLLTDKFPSHFRLYLREKSKYSFIFLSFLFSAIFVAFFIQFSPKKILFFFRWSKLSERRSNFAKELISVFFLLLCKR